jgi:phosphocarrier protein
MLKKTITIINKLGLHARAAAKLVSYASRYASTIRIIRNNQEVNGKSIMGVMMLAAAKGSNIELLIEGEDEVDAMAAIENLINERFGEKE